MDSKTKHQFLISWNDADGLHRIEADRIVIQQVEINGWNKTNVETFDGSTTRFFYVDSFTVIDQYKE